MDILQIIMDMELNEESSLLTIENIQSSDLFSLIVENENEFIYSVECHLPLFFYNKKTKKSCFKFSCEYCYSLSLNVEDLKYEIINGNGKNCLYECTCPDCKKIYLR